MIYVLRFSSRVQHVNKDQPELLKQSFILLQLMCRENDKVYILYIMLANDSYN